MTSNIEWVAGDDGRKGKTWNPVRGCWPVSPGCLNCYATRQAIRATAPGKAYEGLVESKLMTIGGKEKRVPRWTGKVSFDVEALHDPLSWRDPARVFVNSMSDLFHDGFTDDQIAAVFGVMALCETARIVDNVQHADDVLRGRKQVRL